MRHHGIYLSIGDWLSVCKDGQLPAVDDSHHMLVAKALIALGKEKNYCFFKLYCLANKLHDNNGFTPSFEYQLNSHLYVLHIFRCSLNRHL